MRSSKVNPGDSGLATQYNNLRSDAYGSSQLLSHQQSSPGMTLYVETGVYWIGGTRVSFAGGNSPTFTAPSANPRIDLLVINNAGTLSIVQGTENASPSVPTYPKDKLVICEIYNRVGETALYDTDQGGSTGYIYNDVRPFLNNGKYISQTLAEIFVASDTGSTNAFAVALNPAITAYNDGLLVAFRAANANTSACTLAVNGLSAVPIKKAVSIPLSANDILANQIVIVEYDASQGVFQMQSMVGNLPAGFVSANGDGNAVLNGSNTFSWASLNSNVYTLTRDIYPGNLTINNGVTLITNSYCIFCQGTLTNNGTIKNNGNNGNTGGNATMGNPSTAGGGAGGGSAVAAGTLAAGVAGVSGGNGASSSGFNYNGLTGGSGSAGNNASNSLATNNGVAGGSGGSGGSGGGWSGGGGGGGSSGGTATQATMGPYTMISLLMACSVVLGVFTTYKSSPSGAGGGGGGSGGSGSNGSGSNLSCGGGGGGSGSSGGMIWIVANAIINNGTIQSNGGNGGNGGNGCNGYSYNGGAMNGGGGGGGGAGGNGGVIVLAYVSYTNNGTVQALGGSPGTGGSPGSGSGTGATSGSSGSTGNSGNAGTILQIVI